MNLTEFQQFRNEPIVDPWKQDESKKNLLAGIEEARKILKSPHKILVGKNWVEGDEGTFQNVNPNRRDEKFGLFPIASLKQAETTIEFAKKSQKEWAKKTATERAKILGSFRQK